jgi:hypothetical protein
MLPVRARVVLGQLLRRKRLQPLPSRHLFDTAWCHRQKHVPRLRRRNVQRLSGFDQLPALRPRPIQSRFGEVCVPALSRSNLQLSAWCRQLQRLSRGLLLRGRLLCPAQLPAGLSVPGKLLRAAGVRCWHLLRHVALPAVHILPSRQLLPHRQHDGFPTLPSRQLLSHIQRHGGPSLPARQLLPHRQHDFPFTLPSRQLLSHIQRHGGPSLPARQLLPHRQHDFPFTLPSRQLLPHIQRHGGPSLPARFLLPRKRGRHAAMPSRHVQPVIQRLRVPRLRFRHVQPPQRQRVGLRLSSLPPGQLQPLRQRRLVLSVPSMSHWRVLSVSRHVFLRAMRGWVVLSHNGLELADSLSRRQRMRRQLHLSHALPPNHVLPLH